MAVLHSLLRHAGDNRMWYGSGSALGFLISAAIQQARKNGELVRFLIHALDRVSFQPLVLCLAFVNFLDACIPELQKRSKCNEIQRFRN